MIIRNRHTMIANFDLNNPNQQTGVVHRGTFHRVGYFLHLQHMYYGNQWVYTEFDTFTDKIEHIGVPKTVFNKDVYNVMMCRDGVYSQYDKGRLFFTPNDYIPSSNVPLGLEYGTYGAMQLRIDEDVIWSYNNHNGEGDIGIGNAPMGFRDWTLYNNASEYSIKNMRIFVIDVHFKDFEFLPTVGYIDGDTPMWNADVKQWMAKRIPYDTTSPASEPNFIIVLTGQSNSQGWNAFYDETNSNDQIDERIMAFNEGTNEWVTADMRNESIGSFWYRQQNSQSLAFHFAKRLVEIDENIRPGIINMGVPGQCIARWVTYEPGHVYYDVNMIRSNGNQGDIFAMHKHKIESAMTKIKKKTIDVICWHQGESDMDVTHEYYRDSVYRVIDQYRALTHAGAETPFIVGETTGHRFGDDTWWVKQNNVLNGIEGDGDPNTRCVRSRDLRTNGPKDGIHFNADGHRQMGTLYFRMFRDMIS
jgi:hypothetical protein